MYRCCGTCTRSCINYRNGIISCGRLVESNRVEPDLNPSDVIMPLPRLRNVAAPLEEKDAGVMECGNIYNRRCRIAGTAVVCEYNPALPDNNSLLMSHSIIAEACDCVTEVGC